MKKNKGFGAPWYVPHIDFSDHYKIFNIFNNILFTEYFDKQIRKYCRHEISYDDILNETRRGLCWQEWSRVEYEFGISDGVKDSVKLDAYIFSKDNLPWVVAASLLRIGKTPEKFPDALYVCKWRDDKPVEEDVLPTIDKVDSDEWAKDSLVHVFNRLTDDPLWVTSPFNDINIERITVKDQIAMNADVICEVLNSRGKNHV